MIYPLLAIAALYVLIAGADTFSTLLAIRIGLLEGNPVMSFILKTAQRPGFVAVQWLFGLIALIAAYQNIGQPSAPKILVCLALISLARAWVVWHNWQLIMDRLGR